VRGLQGEGSLGQRHLQGTSSVRVGPSAEVVNLLVAALDRVGGATRPQARPPPAAQVPGSHHMSARQGSAGLDAATFFRDLEGALTQRQGLQGNCTGYIPTQPWHELQEGPPEQFPGLYSRSHGLGDTLGARAPHPAAMSSPGLRGHLLQQQQLLQSSSRDGAPAGSYSAAQNRSLEVPPPSPRGMMGSNSPEAAPADWKRMGSSSEASFSIPLEDLPLSNMRPGGAAGRQASDAMPGGVHAAAQQPASGPSADLSLEEIERILMDT